MPDVHVPRLDGPDDQGATADNAPVPPAPPHRAHRSALLEIALEVALIATGVFLGLAGEQWREHARHRELAEMSLRRLRTEMIENHEAIDAVEQYRVDMLNEVKAYLAADPKTRSTDSVQLNGLRPVNFEHSAWDLALATQSLADIDPPIAFDLARIYNAQQTYGDLSRGILQALYLQTPKENPEAFWSAVRYYYGDVVLIEPGLVKMHDDLLPRIDRALGERARASAQ